MRERICPECGNKKFFVTVHVMQEWTVDARGNFVEVADECLDVTRGPECGDFWTCTECGAEAVEVF